MRPPPFAFGILDPVNSKVLVKAQRPGGMPEIWEFPKNQAPLIWTQNQRIPPLLDPLLRSFAQNGPPP